MTTQPSSGLTAMRWTFWRMAATATDVVLRHREQLRSAWPYLTLLAGGMLAYALGRWVGALAFSTLP